LNGVFCLEKKNNFSRQIKFCIYQVDNREMRAPVKLQGGKIDITFYGKYLRVVTQMGVTVDFDGTWQTNIYVPMDYKGK
jgi:hypothetical protein